MRDRRSVQDLLAELDRFLVHTVGPLETKHQWLLEDPRQRYSTSGPLCRQVLKLKRRVRMAASAAGLYGLMISRESGAADWAGRVNVVLAEWQRLGLDGQAAAIAASGHLAGTISTAGRFVGLSCRAVAHAHERTQPVGSQGRPHVRRLLADCVSDIESVDFLAQALAARADADLPTGHLESIRRTAPEICGRVYARAMLAEGSEGQTSSAHLFDAWHQSMVVQVSQAAMHDMWQQELIGTFQVRSWEER